MKKISKNLKKNYDQKMFKKLFFFRFNPYFNLFRLLQIHLKSFMAKFSEMWRKYDVK